MTTKVKAILITSVILLASGVTLYAMRRKKPVADAIKKVKKVGSIIWPAGATDSEAVTESGKDSVTIGDKGTYVEQLQNALNDLHRATAYINKNNCSLKWPLFSQFPTASNGNILSVTGIFDEKTSAVSQFYLNRKEVDLDYLKLIKQKLSAYNAGDKCIYPLGITL